MNKIKEIGLLNKLFVFKRFKIIMKIISNFSYEGISKIF